MKPAKILMGVLGLFFVASLGGNYYLWNQYQAQKALANNPKFSSQQEVNQIVSKIRSFMDLPTNEDPTVATVLDVSKLKDQPFFKDAQNGDKVVIYSKRQQAILYRPSTNRIVEVAPIAISNTQNPSGSPNPSESPSPTQKTRILPNTSPSPSPSPTTTP